MRLKIAFALAFAACLVVAGGVYAADKCYDLVQAGHYDKAIVACDALIGGKVADKSVLATHYNNRGRAYGSLGKNDKAIADFTKAIELDPKLARAYLYRGIVYKMTSKYDNALADLNKAASLNPKSAMTFFNLAEVYAAKGMSDKAIADYTKVIAIDPKRDIAYNNRGDIYMTKKKYAAAEKDIKKALEINPGNMAAAVSLAEVYSGMKKTTDSCKWLNAGIEKGFKDWGYVKTSKSFDNIRPSECYKKIMAGK